VTFRIIINVKIMFDQQGREVIGPNHKACKSGSANQMGRQHSRGRGERDGRHRANALRTRLRSLRESTRLWRTGQFS